MPTLSLCVIAKDEEQNIGRCLKSAKPFVDQMVVVDTGSIDFTVEIAEELGAEVYHHLWQDDFALARNKSLEHATGDWILFLDCDEELDPQTAPLLRQLIETSQYSGYWVKIVNMFNNQANTAFQGFRLFRNHPNHRFECPIHEQILPSVIKNTSSEQIAPSELTIYHHGYENDQTIFQSKIERNLRLLQKAMKDYGHTGFIPFYMAVEHQKLGNFEKALEYYQLSLQKTDARESYAPAMIRSMMFCYLNLNRFSEGLIFADRFLQVYPNYTDLVYLRGLLYARLEKDLEALSCMNQCLKMGPPPIHLFSTKGIASEMPLEFIRQWVDQELQKATILVKQGKTNQAFTALNSVFNQLKKTPLADPFNRMIQTMITILSGAQ